MSKYQEFRELLSSANQIAKENGFKMISITTQKDPEKGVDSIVLGDSDELLSAIVSVFMDDEGVYQLFSQAVYISFNEKKP